MLVETDLPPPHEHDFSSQWMDMNPYHHHAPLQQYGAGFTYLHPAPNGAMESAFNRIMPPPPPASLQLQPLLMPQWPSMLANHSAYPPPPLQTVSLSPSARNPKTPPSATKSPAPRRTLTDLDRKRMCQYHEENPTVKQTEIGAMFGVERSTVSKVLRQKEKYMSPVDPKKSPVRRSKGKFPDIERALSNWARNCKRQGVRVTDEMLRDKGHFFATSVGNSENHSKINSTTWIEKFKQKNHLNDAKSSARRAPKVLAAPLTTNLDPPSATTTNSLSPLSPLNPSPRPLLPKKETKPEGSGEAAYPSNRSHSTASLSSLSMDPELSYSAPPLSPGTSFFNNEGSNTAYLPSHQTRLPPLTPGFCRPRSQTFPMLTIDPTYIPPPVSSDALSPRTLAHLPVERASSPPPPDLDVSSPGATNSPASIPPPPHTTPKPAHHSSNTPDLHPPPSPEEARRAMELVMVFFTNQPTGFVDRQDYVAMGKLMEKLRLQGAPLPPIAEDENLTQKLEQLVSAAQ
ncbi:MAG: hypothetical protein M1829_003497 [Trizodia sp. TS-e1964]|nr:MAG: hypothetical protein M1829_003497 [Trizodia sp. TS-e1964]